MRDTTRNSTTETDETHSNGATDSKERKPAIIHLADGDNIPAYDHETRDGCVIAFRNSGGVRGYRKVSWESVLRIELLGESKHFTPDIRPDAKIGGVTRYEPAVDPLDEPDTRWDAAPKTTKTVKAYEVDGHVYRADDDQGWSDWVVDTAVAEYDDVSQARRFVGEMCHVMRAYQSNPRLSDAVRARFNDDNDVQGGSE